MAPVLDQTRRAFRAERGQLLLTSSFYASAHPAEGFSIMGKCEAVSYDRKRGCLTDNLRLLGYKDSNLEMTESESVALPFGDSPLYFCCCFYRSQQDVLYMVLIQKSTPFFKIYPVEKNELQGSLLLYKISRLDICYQCVITIRKMFDHETEPFIIETTFHVHRSKYYEYYEFDTADRPV